LASEREHKELLTDQEKEMLNGKIHKIPSVENKTSTETKTDTLLIHNILPEPDSRYDLLLAL
jgi:hypothetical protein